MNPNKVKKLPLNVIGLKRRHQAAEVSKNRDDLVIINDSDRLQDRAISASVSHLGIKDRNPRNDYKTGANTPLVKRNPDSSMKIESASSVKLLH